MYEPSMLAQQKIRSSKFWVTLSRDLNGRTRYPLPAYEYSDIFCCTLFHINNEAITHLFAVFGIRQDGHHHIATETSRGPR